MSGDIDIGEFNEFLQTVYGNCQTREVEILFNSVDKSGKGSLSRNDLKQAIQNKLDLKSEVTISYTDIIIPLATTVKTRLQLQTGQLFDQFQQGGRINSTAFMSMISMYLGIEVS